MRIDNDINRKNADGVILPIEMPKSSTYMVPAAEFALLQTTDSGKNYINNRYAQMYLFGNILNQKSYDVGLTILTDPFDQNPCFKTTKIELEHEFIISDQKTIIIQCLNEGTYYYSYRYMDEFYISDTKYYQKCCVLHMFLIYGYSLSEKSFYTLGYNRNGIFSKIRIRFDEFDESIKHLDKKEHRYIMLLNNNNNYMEKECNLDLIKFWMDQYIKSKNSRIVQRGVNNEIAVTDNLIFGYRTYDYILLYLNYFIKNEAPFWEYDFRYSRQLLEHKRIMHERLTILCKNKLIKEDIVGQYNEIVECANIIHYLNIKFSLTKEHSIFVRILDNLVKIISKEKNILEEVLRLI